MGILLSCDNSPCFQTTEALYDKENGEVYCQECNKPITNLTRIMKNQLRNSNQTTQSAPKKAQGSFNVMCKSCKRAETPILGTDVNSAYSLSEPSESKTLLCKHCKKPLIITPQFKLMFMDWIKTNK